MYVHSSSVLHPTALKQIINALYMASIIIYNDETVTAFAIPSGLKYKDNELFVIVIELFQD